ncbi:MAG: GAF domain-containing protein [Armatimonadetes bacterium]|nr:GAF domain-containing protein [Anaerolineae bacterium]
MRTANPVSNANTVGATLTRLRKTVFGAPYFSIIDQNRAAMVYALTLFILATYTLYAVGVRQWAVDGEAQSLLVSVIRNGIFNPTALLFLTLYVLSAAAILAVRIGRLELGCWLLMGAWYASGVLLQVYAQDTLEALGLPLAQTILLATLLLRWRGLIISTPTVCFTLWAAWWLDPSPLDNVQLPLADIGLMIINLLSAAGVIALFLRFFRLSLVTSVSEAVDEGVRLNAILTHTARLLGQRVPSPQLMHAITQSITADFIHLQTARLYLVDSEKPEARLAADSTQPTLPIDQATRYGVGGLSNIGQVTLIGKPVITRHPSQSTVDLTLALRVADRIIGALELTSDDARVFDNPAVIEAFQTLANNVALAIDNALQFELSEQRLKQNEKQIEQIRGNLRDFERLNQRLTGSVWSQYLRNYTQELGLNIDFTDNNAQSAAPWTDTLSEAFTINHLVQQQQAETQVIAVPLRVRGQVIGAMEFELERERGFTPEDLALLQEVGERFGMAAENTRLLEESQRAAQREALVNQISARLQTSTGVNTTILEAARGLRDALKAGKVAIRLGVPANTSPPPPSK